MVCLDDHVDGLRHGTNLDIFSVVFQGEIFEEHVALSRADMCTLDLMQLYSSGRPFARLTGHIYTTSTPARTDFIRFQVNLS